MAKAKEKTQYREGTLGWFLMEAGWEAVEQVDCPRGGQHRLLDNKCEKCREFVYPLWRFEGFDVLKTAEEARELELKRIDNEFKAKARKLPVAAMKTGSGA